MTAEQHEQFQLHLPIMVHVWNNTPDSDTQITPFEAEHGMPMRCVAESLTQDPPSEGLPTDANDLETVAKSVSAYMEIMTDVKAVERTLAAKTLNERGFAKVKYQIGDRVTFYLPPTQKQAQRMGKNPKYMLHYAGPGEIIKSLSNNGSAWEISWNGRTYQRNVMHMHHYEPDKHVLQEQLAVQDNTVMVGSYVAVLDNDDDNNYHVAQVIAMTDGMTRLHYLATKSKALRSAT